MKEFRQLGRLLAAAFLITGLSGSIFAQDPSDRNQRKNETSMTGCLSKDSSGNYTLTDEKTGSKTSVTGASDLDKHAANHRVTLIGTAKADDSGKTVFEVSKIQHLSSSCKTSSE
jgi:hypothetical protein